MANSAGYTVIRGAIPLPLIQQALPAIKDMKVIKEMNKYTEYEVPPVCYDIRDEFIRNRSGEPSFAEFLARNPVPQFRSVHNGVFRKSAPDTKGYCGENEVIYVTIALTDLKPENGWYIFVEGSYDRSPSAASSWKKASVRLNAGDAMVWRGDLIYFHPPDGGGVFATLVYGPGRQGNSSPQ